MYYIGILYCFAVLIKIMSTIQIVSKPVPDDAEIFDLDLKTQTAKEDSNYKMKCMLKVKALTFWTVDGRVPDGAKFKILPDSNLLVRNISRDDFGREYLCHAIIPGRQTVESMQIELIPFHTRREDRVLNHEQGEDVGEPRREEKKVFAIIGELKTLSCTVRARPYPDFKWLYKNGTLIHNKTDIIISSLEDVSNLTIFMRSSNHFGEYICEAWNSLGKTVQNFVISMPEKPNEVPFIYPKVIGLSRIMLGVNYDKMKNYSVHVQFKVVDDIQWNGNGNDRDDYLTDSVELAHLQPNTTYLIRAALKNDFVLGDYSDAIRVTTDKDTSNVVVKDRNQANKATFHGDKGFGRSLDFDFHPGMTQKMDWSKEGFLNSVNNKFVNSTTWTFKKMSRVDAKVLIVTNTSTVEEISEDSSST